MPARGSTLRATRPDYTPVSDTRTRFVIDYRAGEGAVSVKLTKRSDIFIGKLQADGTALIRRARTDAPGDFETLCTTRVNALTPGRKVAFSFENLDHRVRMHVDGREVLVSTDEQYSPNVAALRAAPTAPSLPPSISARNIQIELSHVVVESDVYYLSEITRDSAPLGYKAWGTRNNPILLRPGEYFMLGDNSAQSKDSRLWNTVGPHLVGRGEDYQLGTVPRDQLIGRAFFVYWPSGLRTSLIPFLKEWGWIPNFGRMRWIR